MLQGCSADTFTVAHLFREAGYATGATGKWGLGFPGSESTPGKMGFDFFFGYNCQLRAHEYYPSHLWRNDERVALGGKVYSHDLIAEETLGFIRAHRDRPFFLYAAFTIPHAKLQVPDLGPYENEAWPDNLKTLAAMIKRPDVPVAEVVGENENHVRRTGIGGPRRGGESEEGGDQFCFHGDDGKAPTCRWHRWRSPPPEKDARP